MKMNDIMYNCGITKSMKFVYNILILFVSKLVIVNLNIRLNVAYE